MGHFEANCNREPLSANYVYTRCVSGSELTVGSLTNNKDGTYSDKNTLLMWRKGSESDGNGMMNLGNALRYCENMNYEGYSDWRLPNLIELSSILDYSTYSPSAPGILDSESADYVSSSTRDFIVVPAEAMNFNTAIEVNFNKGYSNLEKKDSGSSYARCVRGGQVGNVGPSATITGAPSNTTASTEVTITVGGADVQQYVYRLDDELSYSDSKDVGTPISISGLKPGIHTLYILAYDSAGELQLSPTTATWIVATGLGATPIVIDKPNVDHATFSDVVTERWFAFAAVEGEVYTLRGTPITTSLDLALFLYDADAATLLSSSETNGAGTEEQLSWTCPYDGVYYIKIVNVSATNKADTIAEYTYAVTTPYSAISEGIFSGKVSDTGGNGIGNAIVTFSSTVKRAGLTCSDGSYIIVAPSGSYSVSTSAPGFKSKIEASQLQLYASCLITHDVILPRSSTAYSFTYYVPYLAFDGSHSTGLALSNGASTESNSALVSFYDNSGTSLGTQTITLDAAGQKAWAVPSVGTDGWAKVESVYPLEGLTLIMDALSGPMVDIDLKATLNKELTIAHVATESGYWESSFMACNPNDAEATVVLNYLAEDGSSPFTAKYISIPAHGALQQNLSDLFPKVSRGSVRITATQGIAAFLLYDGLQAQQTDYQWKAGLSVTPAVSGNSGSYTSYIPYLALTGTYSSGIAFSNAAASVQNNVTVSYYGNSGMLLSTDSFSLAAGGQTAKVVQLSSSEDGWAKVTSTYPLAGIELIMGTDDRAPMIDIDMKSSLYNALTVPHVATADGQWASTLMMCNPNSCTATVTLKYTDTTGATGSAQEITIPAQGAKQQDLSEIFPGVSGGAIAISSTVPVAGFLQFDGQDQGTAWKAGLSVVPAK